MPDKITKIEYETFILHDQHGQRYYDWQLNFDMANNTANWNNEVKFKMYCSLMNKTIYMKLIEQNKIRNYDEANIALKEYFLIDSILKGRYNALRNCVYQNNNIVKFVKSIRRNADIINYAVDLNEKISDREIYNIFMNGLSPELKGKFILTEFNRIEDAIPYIKEYETLKRQKKNFMRNFQQNNNQQFTNNNFRNNNSYKNNYYNNQ